MGTTPMLNTAECAVLNVLPLTDDESSIQKTPSQSPLLPITAREERPDVTEENKDFQGCTANVPVAAPPTIPASRRWSETRWSKGRATLPQSTAEQNVVPTRANSEVISSPGPLLADWLKEQ
eukprot:Selendium_serpulae@DN1092_c0_g1_i1.p1